VFLKVWAGMTLEVPTNTAASRQTLEELRRSPDPRASCEAIMGQTAPQQRLTLTAEDMQEYRDYAAGVQAALRQPPAEAKGVIDGLEAQRSRLSGVEQDMAPNAQKVNLVRLEVMTARADLLGALDAVIK
jgi:hypothetical protein